MGKYRDPHFEFPASSSPNCEFSDAENSNALSESSCPPTHSSSPPAEDSDGLTNMSCPTNHLSFLSLENSDSFNLW